MSCAGGYVIAGEVKYSAVTYYSKETAQATLDVSRAVLLLNDVICLEK